MKIFLLVHIVYATSICTLFLVHVGYPLYSLEKKKASGRTLKTLYNKKIAELDLPTVSKEEKDILKNLREIVVFSKYVSENTVKKCIEAPFQHKDTIKITYSFVQKEVALPKKVFLFYSKECNAGLFLSLSVPLLFVALCNIKSLNQ